MVVIRILGLASGPMSKKSPPAYVSYFDPDAANGLGKVDITSNIKDAKKFASSMEAFVFYQQVSKVKPTRPDGKPNKPLTAYHVQIMSEADVV